jgi:hypothetical protein
MVNAHRCPGMPTRFRLVAQAAAIGRPLHPRSRGSEAEAPRRADAPASDLSVPGYSCDGGGRRF